ncbi:TetR/AcrR family transcriptional regulator [Limosilactobacillus sp.]|jgi:AcrR family transcriptional regulator|uniref:TetR/AcrR family transcriptional regulator n=1 Tax=Limosilactobacillus sp. TaxID=2773925 RepID=UPI0025C2895C|nr:TetR/AcrR family transcriptional regulator C-terminal domain-containing protein [Limosilactobacillus sp.]MCH3922058.1 TetR/AcrR family transcriptional regulator [Limosilactobacillus sp.]MCH3928829.1 TetR/AcrR family transcriptional regulator [Limosilactobacillus sp.]
MTSDLRFRRTEYQIQKTFVKLVNQKGFRHTTVGDIAKMAHINRATFYAHYLDKYDLLDSLEETTINVIRKILKETTFANDEQESWQAVLQKNQYLVFKQLANYLYSNRPLILALFQDVNFRNEVQKVLIAETNARRKRIGLSFNDELPREYAEELIITSFLGIIIQWLKKKRPESPNDFAGTLLKCAQLLPLQLLMRKD